MILNLSVHAVPMKHGDESILPLDSSHQYTIKCLNDGMAYLNRETMNKSPFLTVILDMDTTSHEMILADQGCNPETLALAVDYMKGHAIWNRITAFNVEDLIIFADYLELTDLLDRCILWTIRGIFLNQFQISHYWNQSYPEHADEIHALSKAVTSIHDIQTHQLVITVNGSELFEKFKKIKRFSKLVIKANGTLTAPRLDVASKESSPIVKVESLQLNGHNQSDFAFLANNVHYPVLKKLFLNSADLSDLRKLSEAFNNQKMPQLEELNLSFNSKLQLDTFQLRTNITLKSLDLGWCKLTNVSFLENLLRYMPYLERLNLFGNEKIDLKTFHLNSDISLKYLNLGICGLRSVLGLGDALEKMPQLEELDLSWNYLQLDSLMLEREVPLKILNMGFCGLTNTVLLSNVLSKMPYLEELCITANSEQVERYILMNFEHLKLFNGVGFSIF